MKTPSETPPSETPPKARRRLSLALAGLAAVVVVAGLVWVVWQYQTRNYAKEVAKPLETALAKAGGVKKCDTGDAGRGTDNNRPHYEAYFVLPTGKADATVTANKLASEAGYHLTPATPSNKGHLSAVDDSYIQDWFFDDTSKSSPYRDLSSGPIELGLGINASGAKEACGNTVPITVDGTHSVVNVQVQMPEFKR